MTLHIQSPQGESQLAQPAGLRLSDAAEKVGLALNLRCGGLGACGGCAAKLEAGRYRVGQDEVTVPEGGYEVAASCQTVVLSEQARVVFPATSVLERRAQIDADFEPDVRPAEPLTRRHAEAGPMGSGMVIQVERGDAVRVISRSPGNQLVPHLGVAVDIGTTTVAAVLVDISTRTILARASMYNQQLRRADDVASRISYCASDRELRELQKLVVDDTINVLVRELCRQTPWAATSISHLVVSGNTVMSHLFHGLSPGSLGRAPFTPVTLCYEPRRARDLGLAVHPEAEIEVIPSLSAYLGGDLASDIAVTGLPLAAEPTLLVDIGTNGEIIYSEGGRLSGCATAAGPAFEGYGTSHGCRAAAGAIEHVAIDEPGTLRCRVIGDVKPVGICGSGIIDFIAEAARCGLINRLGRFQVDRLQAWGLYLKDSSRCGDSVACRLVDGACTAHGQSIAVSEADIAQVMKAKAAIYAGMKILLQARQRRWGQVARILLAGGFARHISLRHAIGLGLLPDLPLDRYVLVGNGSLAGAFRALLDRTFIPSCAGLVGPLDVVDLNGIPGFEDEWIDALAIPHLQDDEFPSRSHSADFPEA